MFKLFSMAIFSLALTSGAHVFAAGSDDPYFNIQQAVVEEVPVSAATLADIRAQFKAQQQQNQNQVWDDENPLNVINDANQVVDGIINIGAKIWKIFEASTPVVNLSTQRANALPKGLKDWTDMDSWSDVQAKQYSVSFNNGFNSEVVRFNVLFTYSYNGAYSGKGKYLNQVGFLVNDYYVAPLYRLDANSEVVRVQNVGTKDAPIAGMEINLVYNVSNVLHKLQSGLNYYLRGDGNLTFREAPHTIR